MQSRNSEYSAETSLFTLLLEHNMEFTLERDDYFIGSHRTTTHTLRRESYLNASSNESHAPLPLAQITGRPNYRDALAVFERSRPGLQQLGTASAILQTGPSQTSQSSEPPFTSPYQSTLSSPDSSPVPTPRFLQSQGTSIISSQSSEDDRDNPGTSHPLRAMDYILNNSLANDRSHAIHLQDADTANHLTLSRSDDLSLYYNVFQQGHKISIYGKPAVNEKILEINEHLGCNSINYQPPRTTPRLSTAPTSISPPPLPHNPSPPPSYASRLTSKLVTRMGNALDSCFGKKGDDEAVIIEAKEEFSWQKKKKLDPADYTFEDLVGVTAGKLPGQINGEQFSIENCKDCVLFVLDNVATVTIDDCTNCVIFIGPSKGSVFIRDSSDVKLAVSCQQFRSRDCKRVDTFLHSNTQPIIESSSTMKFTCLEFYYKQLYDQFEASGLSMYNNEWSNVFDFSPVTDMQNFSLLPQTIKFDSFLTQTHVKEVCDKYGEEEVVISSERSVFPLTVGNRSSGTDQQNTLLVLFLGSNGTYSQVNNVLDSLKKSKCYLRRSKEVSMTSDDVKRIFQSSDNISQYINAAKLGHVIGLEVEGSYDYATKLELLNYTSSENSSGRDLNAFFNFVDMTMST